jgi:biopolymer transport protein ExbB
MVWLFAAAVALSLATSTFRSHAPVAYAQNAGGPAADDTVAGPSAGPESTPTSQPPPTTLSVPNGKREINFFELLVSGGFFMWPILGMSIIAVTFGIERFINLRRSKIIPRRLASALGQLGNSATGFDPRSAYRICQQFPSVASTVIRAMLLKVGRPHSEVEQAVRDTLQREADRMYVNVRWLNLSVAVAPLIGLLGTVWGLIICFHDLTQLAPGANRATELANGIYIAMVTTLGGLMVAIPAACVSHFFEGKIQNLMFEVEEMVFGLMPQVEKYEGRLRFGKPGENGDKPPTLDPTPSTAASPTPPPHRPAAAKS